MKDSLCQAFPKVEECKLKKGKVSVTIVGHGRSIGAIHLQQFTIFSDSFLEKKRRTLAKISDER